MKGLIWVVILLLCACVPRYRVSTLQDEFAGTHLRHMRGNVLVAPGGAREWIALDAEARKAVGDSVRYSLIVDYRDTGDWLRIGPGETLILLVEGERLALGGSGAGRAAGAVSRALGSRPATR